jgi:hypothetical protein
LVLAPLAWLLGVPWEQATLVGGAIGQKIAVHQRDQPDEGDQHGADRDRDAETLLRAVGGGLDQVGRPAPC